MISRSFVLLERDTQTYIIGILSFFFFLACSLLVDNLKSVRAHHALILHANVSV